MGRLFWKIFLWFWLSLVLLSLLLLFVSLTRLAAEEGRSPLLERHLAQRLDTVALALRYGGPNALREYHATTAHLRPRVWVLDAEGEDLLGRRIPRVISTLEPARLLRREVVSADGTTYHLMVFRPNLQQNNVDGLRWLWLSRGVPDAGHALWFLLLSALTCGWLSWYITRPVRLIARAAHMLEQDQQRMAAAPPLGRRRDELVDLAGAFDRMADALQARQQAFQQLLNDVSHELRSPLTRLRLRLALLARQHPTQGDEQQAIDGELDRLEELIDQVLTLARLDARQRFPRDDYLDLVGLLQVLCDNVRIEAEVKGCVIHYDCAAKELLLRANAELLQRAFENLLRNALAHTAADSQVRVSLYLDEASQVIVDVLDQGPGVPEAQLAEIFSPFVRLDSARSGKGFGLGLAIAQRAIQRHGGDIQAANVPPDGLQVRVRLPLG